MWSNSSRCRQESVYLSRTWCLYTVIFLPTVILMLSWEKPLVKCMAPGLISIIQVSNLFYFAIFTFNLYHKNTKNIYPIISIKSHFCKWSWRDWQPLYRVGCEVLICLCRYEVTRAWSPTGLIPWFSKTKGNTYAALPHHPFLFKGKPTRCSRGSTRQGSRWLWAAPSRFARP